MAQLVKIDKDLLYKKYILENKRQAEIIEHLKCGFIRLNEDGKEILNLKYGTVS